jgi:hypothetical protein
MLYYVYNDSHKMRNKPTKERKEEIRVGGGLLPTTLFVLEIKVGGGLLPTTLFIMLDLI